MKNLILLTLVHLLSAIVGQSQSLTVSGRVLYNPKLNDCFQEVLCLQDTAFTKEEDWIAPKAAVNILVKGTDMVSKTDPMGHYSIDVPSDRDTLQFLYIGHNRLEVPVLGRKVLDIKLTPTPIPVIERLLDLIMPEIDAGSFPDIDHTSREANTSRATARDVLWLVLGNTRMKEHYPGEFIPDYRFSE